MRPMELIKISEIIQDSKVLYGFMIKTAQVNSDE